MPEDDTTDKTASNAIFSSSRADGNVHHHLPEDREDRQRLSSLDVMFCDPWASQPTSAPRGSIAVVLPLDVTRYTVMTKSRNLQAHSLGSDKLTKDCPTAGEAHVRWMSCGVDGGRRIDCPEQHGW